MDQKRSNQTHKEAGKQLGNTAQKIDNVMSPTIGKSYSAN